MSRGSGRSAVSAAGQRHGDVCERQGRVALAMCAPPPAEPAPLTPSPWRVPSTRRDTTRSQNLCRPEDQVLSPRDSLCPPFFRETSYVCRVAGPRLPVDVEPVERKSAV